MEFKDQGVCRFCLKMFAGTAMGRHLSACPARKEADKSIPGAGRLPGSIYHLRISAYKFYWLHIEVDSASPLRLIDGFLRDIWLECCGHLSAFTIRGEDYSVTSMEEAMLPWGMETNSMDVPVNRVLEVGDTFDYQYDFGSTTRLEGRVVAERRGVLPKPVRILARNNPLPFQCSGCGKPATEICLDCDELFCGRCLEKHGADSLPVVNSPRMGVCGYTGQGDFDDFPAG